MYSHFNLVVPVRLAETRRENVNATVFVCNIIVRHSNYDVALTLLVSFISFVCCSVRFGFVLRSTTTVPTLQFSKR